MDWSQAVDIYCERTGPQFWSEPVNALTNASFLAAGIAGLWLARRDAAGRWVEILCLLVCAIGVGSFLFHTIATRWAAAADTVPIWTFFVAYVVFALRRFFRLGWPATLAWFAAGAGGIWAMLAAVPEGASAATNGSIQYLPSIVALLVFSAALAIAGRPAAGHILAAAGIFAVSLAFRTVDGAACAWLPIGTHFLWHLLNGLMLFILLHAAVRHGRPIAEARLTEAAPIRPEG